MTTFYLGVYWKHRRTTLREYADASRAFLKTLQDAHPVFRSLAWAGLRPNSTVSLDANLANLDALIYQNAGSTRALHTNPNPDGTPSWQSTCALGYTMFYSTVQGQGSVPTAVSISTGKEEEWVSNAVTISFPCPSEGGLVQGTPHDYDLLKNILVAMIKFWQADEGRLTSQAFSDAVRVGSLPHAGWLTFVSDPRAAALQNDSALDGLTFETIPERGVLMSLGRAMVSPENTDQVELARRLDHKLAAEKLIS